MIVSETPLARVPNQLISPDDAGQGKEDVADESEEVADVNEFSSAGGGSIMGYSLPLGMDPDSAGRKKNKVRSKK